MNASLLRVALRHIGGWMLLIFFVSLLSIIFSFLGTIFCAALAGMMLGAMRQGRWRAVPVSFVFPAVIFTLLRGAKVDLSGDQIKMLSLLCFGTFWLVYLVAVGLMKFEGKGGVPKAEGARQRTRGTPAAQALATSSPGPSSKASAPACCGKVSQELNLESLQGKWRCNGGTAGAHIREKVIEVQREQMVLTITDDNGRLALRANAKLRLETAGLLQSMVLSTANAESASDFLVSI